jgi:hypothetical protein
MTAVGSAGEHEWREVTVHIFPTITGARFAVLTKKKKGARTVWQRNLCVYEVVEADTEVMETLAGVLAGCAHVLTVASARAARDLPAPQ